MTENSQREPRRTATSLQADRTAGLVMGVVMLFVLSRLHVRGINAILIAALAGGYVAEEWMRTAVRWVIGELRIVRDRSVRVSAGIVAAVAAAWLVASGVPWAPVAGIVSVVFAAMTCLLHPFSQPLDTLGWLIGQGARSLVGRIQTYVASRHEAPIGAPVVVNATPWRSHRQGAHTRTKGGLGRARAGTPNSSATPVLSLREARRQRKLAGSAIDAELRQRWEANKRLHPE